MSKTEIGKDARPVPSHVQAVPLSAQMHGNQAVQHQPILVPQELVTQPRRDPRATKQRCSKMGLRITQPGACCQNLAGPQRHLVVARIPRVSNLVPDEEKDPTSLILNADRALHDIGMRSPNRRSIKIDHRASPQKRTSAVRLGDECQHVLHRIDRTGLKENGMGPVDMSAVGP